MAHLVDIKKNYVKEFTISWNQHLKYRTDSKEGNYLIKTNGVIEEKHLTDQDFFRIWFDVIWYNKKEIITTMKISD